MKHPTTTITVIAVCLLVLTSPFSTSHSAPTTHTAQAKRTTTAVCTQTTHKEPPPNRAQTKHTTTPKRTTLNTGSDAYYAVVESTVRKYVEPAGYTVTRISRLQIPYFNIECSAPQQCVGALPETGFQITQKIYNDLLKYDFTDSDSMVQWTNEILSISYIVYSGTKPSARFDIQWDLTDIDRTKSFQENLKLKLMREYPTSP